MERSLVVNIQKPGMKGRSSPDLNILLPRLQRKGEQGVDKVGCAELIVQARLPSHYPLQNNTWGMELKIYLLMTHYNYEGSEVLAVYSDKNKAYAAHAELQEIRKYRYEKEYFTRLENLVGKDKYQGDDESVVEWEIID